MSTSSARWGLLFAFWLAACGSEAERPAPATEALPITARAARFGTSLDGARVVYPTARFEPGGPFFVSLELGGGPSGDVELRWTWEGHERVASVPVASGESVEDAVFVGARLDEEALPIGVHELRVSQHGEELGRFPFEVGPPEDALPSRIETAQTARGATVDFHPVDPTDTFVSTDAVFLTGCGDFGRGTWIGVQWRVAGEVDEDGTQRITLDADTADTCFAFDFRPHVGWPAGAHEAVLLMNAREIGRYRFTVE